MAARFGSLSMSINTVSAVRSPGLNCDDAIALRRKIAAQINSSADAKTCTPIRALRARPGRASLTSSPRSVRTGSIRVACSAGISAKNPVAPTAATTRNTATRQSAAGTPRLIVAEIERHRAQGPNTRRLPGRDAKSDSRPQRPASASRTLSVISWRTIRFREAPSDSRMPISRWRATPRASSRLATLAQPISRINPKATNSGVKSATASIGCGMVPRCGTRSMVRARGDRSAAAIDWHPTPPAAHARSPSRCPASAGR